MKEYDLVIGLEIHAEIDTKTKAFCFCKNEFGALPNTQVCPICLGLPGTLPILNKKAVEKCIIAGLVFGCDINEETIFERKNYFYPDLSKSYQISQFQKPICKNGGIKLKNGKFVRFNRIHLEEDAGKLIHKDDCDETLIDFNRGGVPLIEMVTEPDLSNSNEVIEFLTNLRRILLYSGVSKCIMQEGGLRFDINLSVKEKNTDNLGVRVEMKNLNSFKAVKKAIEYETNRQIKEIESGNQIIQETRAWNDEDEITYGIREKENVNDYRYFPDPDIVPIKISKHDIESIKKNIPETYFDRINRYKRLGLSDYEIDTLTDEKFIADYFDEVLKYSSNYKEIANWMMTEILRITKEMPNTDIAKLISPESLAYIIDLIITKQLTRNNAKILFEQIINTGKEVKNLIKELDLIGDVNKKDIVDLMGHLINENPNIVKSYKDNPEDIINYCIGRIVKSTNGKAKIEYILPLIKEILKSKIN